MANCFSAAVNKQLSFFISKSSLLVNLCKKNEDGQNQNNVSEQLICKDYKVHLIVRSDGKFNLNKEIHKKHIGKQTRLSDIAASLSVSEKFIVDAVNKGVLPFDNDLLISKKMIKYDEYLFFMTGLYNGDFSLSNTNFDNSGGNICVR